jgi:hypothetical protein
MTADERARALTRYRELEARKVERGLTRAEAYEMDGIAEALDHADEQTAIHRG